MPFDYIGQYGESLRRLDALKRAQTPQQVAPQTAFGQNPAPPLTQGAFGGPAQAPRPEQDVAPMFDPDKPLSAGELWQQMPAEAKEQVAQQLKSSGVSVDDAYQQQVEAGLMPKQKKEPTRDDKLGFLAEVALRTLSNYGKSTNAFSGSDYADAVLETKARRESVDEQLRREAREDTRFSRTERREDERFKRTEESADKRETRARAERAADRAADAAERAKDRAERKADRDEDRKDRALTRKQNRRLATKDDGTLVTIDEDGNAIVVTEEVEVDTPKGKTKKRNPVKVAPKYNASDLDKDSILRAIGQRVKELREDTRLKNALKRKGLTDEQITVEIQRMAQKQVSEEAQMLTTPGRPDAGGTPTRRGALSQNEDGSFTYTPVR